MEYVGITREYDASEQVLQDFKYENKIQGEKELYAFYVRMLASHPKEEYYYNAGSLMYNYAESHPDMQSAHCLQCVPAGMNL
ncbi:MAG: hypothetical protein IPG21_03915 [Saprospiraceae bacterium]|nr:hypothetical protein [Candidatus Vicinibacter affinis]